MVMIMVWIVMLTRSACASGSWCCCYAVGATVAADVNISVLWWQRTITSGDDDGADNHGVVTCYFQKFWTGKMRWR